MFAAQRYQNTLSIMQTRAPAAQPTWAQQWDELKTEWAAGTPTEAIAENLGRSVSAVLTQATRLGLPRRQPQGRKASPHKTAAPRTIRRSNVLMFPHFSAVAEAGPERQAEPVQDRNCMMCTKSFPSRGKHNRICPRCKTGSAYQQGHDDAFRLLSA